jgi:hypothetical protein
MSLVLQSSGGGSVTLEEAVTASNLTITVPAVTGTMATSTTPSFTTTIGVGGATPAASGAGITFPTTQSASSDANTLDDYEEGTWTPNQGSQLTVVGTFSSSGTYIKIGKQVTVWGVLSGSTSVSYNNNAVITSNLPFTVTGFCVGSAVNNSNTAGTFLNPSSFTIYASGAMVATPNIPFTATYITSA